FYSNGDYNTFIGHDCIATASGFSNSVCIGYNSNIDASNKVRIGNTLITSIGGQVGWTTFSDGRYKKNVEEDVPGLDFISKLRPVTYTTDITGLDNHYPKPTPREG
ncbi:MAG: tail fiber domain-containing protein, partial [Bacteroidota bacterium]